MDWRIRELAPEDPTMAEALAWTGRNLFILPVPFMELFGDIDLDGELMKRGLGLLALGGICEVVRRTEHRARQTDDAPQIN